VRKLGLDLNPLLIPPVQGRHGEAVAQIVNARRAASVIENSGGQAEVLPVAGQRHGAINIGWSRTPLAVEQRAVGQHGQAMLTPQFHIAAQFPGDLETAVEKCTGWRSKSATPGGSKIVSG
jgi:hypothetical protein